MTFRDTNPGTFMAVQARQDAIHEQEPCMSERGQ
jgi:hypothetical protein